MDTYQFHRMLPYFEYYLPFWLIVVFIFGMNIDTAGMALIVTIYYGQHNKNIQV